MDIDLQALDYQKILRSLPHRYPFLLVDKIEQIIDDKKIIAYKHLSFNDSFFQGHFPGNPIMPGVLQLEALAQAGAILAAHCRVFNPDIEIAVLKGFERAKFKKIVVPGDSLQLNVEIDKYKKPLCRLKAEARVDGVLSCEAIITAAIIKQD